MNTLKFWLKMAQGTERDELAELSGTSRGYLYFISNPDKSYGRPASPELAARIELAAETIRNRSAEARGRLPALSRVDLSGVCRDCKFARRCLGDRVIAAEFEHLGPVEGEQQVANG
jgi:hypothetical protein